MNSAARPAGRREARRSGRRAARLFERCPRRAAGRARVPPARELGRAEPPAAPLDASGDALAGLDASRPPRCLGTRVRPPRRALAALGDRMRGAALERRGDRASLRRSRGGRPPERLRQRGETEPSASPSCRTRRSSRAPAASIAAIRAGRTPARTSRPAASVRATRSRESERAGARDDQDGDRRRRRDASGRIREGPPRGRGGRHGEDRRDEPAREPIGELRRGGRLARARAREAAGSRRASRSRPRASTRRRAGCSTVDAAGRDVVARSALRRGHGSPVRTDFVEARSPFDQDRRPRPRPRPDGRARDPRVRGRAPRPRLRRRRVRRAAPIAGRNRGERGRASGGRGQPRAASRARAREARRRRASRSRRSRRGRIPRNGRPGAPDPRRGEAEDERNVHAGAAPLAQSRHAPAKKSWPGIREQHGGSRRAPPSGRTSPRAGAAARRVRPARGSTPPARGSSPSFPGRPRRRAAPCRGGARVPLEVRAVRGVEGPRRDSRCSRTAARIWLTSRTRSGSQVTRAVWLAYS